MFSFVSQSGGSEYGCKVSVRVARVAVTAARLVRDLGVGVDAEAAALDLVVGCWLWVSWVTKPAACLVRVLGVSV